MSVPYLSDALSPRRGGRAGRHARVFATGRRGGRATARAQVGPDGALRAAPVLPLRRPARLIAREITLSAVPVGPRPPTT